MAGLLKEVFPHLNSWRTWKNWTTTSVLEAIGSYAALTIQSTSLWHWPLGLCWNWFFLQKFKIVLLFRSARKTLKKKISSQNILFPRIRSVAWPIPALKCSPKFQSNYVLFLLPLWQGGKNLSWYDPKQWDGALKFSFAKIPPPFMNFQEDYKNLVELLHWLHANKNNRDVF